MSTEEQQEQIEILKRYDDLIHHTYRKLNEEQLELIKKAFDVAWDAHKDQRRKTGEPYIFHPIAVAKIVAEEIGLGATSIAAALLHDVIEDSDYTYEDIEKLFGKKIADVVNGLTKISVMNNQNISVQSENYRKLLLTLSDDFRVILIKIADRLHNMRTLDSMRPDKQKKIASETVYIYAPMAHRLGLYNIKSELEDLSLKYNIPEIYNEISEKLIIAKEHRESYVQEFIEHVSEKLKEEKLNFKIKGRAKSISSIYRKMLKQNIPFEEVYDNYAIRVIYKSDFKNEKFLAWKIYSIITDLYHSNPARMRDWITQPRSTGYESLHLTILGPDNKWVEVQIRTKRMDEVAEHGLAAHWRYKGIKSEGNIDEWLANIRSALESNDDLQLMDQFKMDLYEDEVYVFTPKGDLFKFPKGATILDFAYHIHSGVGSCCVGGIINGRNVPIRHPLHSGDTVEILTQNNQKPNPNWLNIAKTSRAKAKIRLALKETQAKDGLYAKELLERRFKNRKIELEEALLYHTIKKMGFKEVSDFYRQVAEEKLNLNEIIDKYVEVRNHELNINAPKTAQSAETFSFENLGEGSTNGTDDVLVIDRNLKGLDYSLAKCCHPIYGDQVFGFVTVNGGIKIHRTDCPNAPELRRRFGYRIVKARWSGKGSSQYSITLNVIGNDDIGIVNNITSIIAKEEKTVLRSINIDSHDGLFRGNLVVRLDDVSKLEALLKKLRVVKGVKQISRI